ncbi:MAG: hypothetical protein HFG80_07820 [Eubacterium sp.]|nr:hypothetical protein [Eubacterium sp.]
MKTLYLHIGTPKTGTTAIQHFCYDNQKLLEERGYCYPMFPYPYLTNRSRLDWKRNGLFLQAIYSDQDGVRNKKIEKEILKNGLQKVRELFQTYNRIILSDEGIWRAAANWRKSIWKELREEAEKGGFTIKVIAYIRKQEELIESWWNQTVKHGISKSNVSKWEEFQTIYPKYINLDYYALLKAAADELGTENIVVRRFHRDFFEGGSLLSDFMHVLGLELTDDYLIPEQSANTKMAENYCEIKRIINGMPEVELKERWRYEHLLRILSPVSDKEYPCRMFSPEEAADFMKTYEESNRKLYETFLSDGKPLFAEKDIFWEKWQADNPHMLTDMVRFLVICDLNRKEEISRKAEEIRRMVEEARWGKRVKKYLKNMWYKCKNEIQEN